VPIDALPDDPEALRALVIRLATERDAALAESQRVSEQNDRLRHLLRQLQRMQFGRRSEKLDPDQFSLALEDLERRSLRARPNRRRPILRSPRACTERSTERPDPAKQRTSSSAVKFAVDSLLEGAVTSEPVSEPKFPVRWENTGYSLIFGSISPNLSSKSQS